MHTRSLQSRVLMQLRDLILKGSFVPGERLAEIPLAERLKASRTPVRLALATLEHEGLIESLPGGGYEMRRYTAKDIADAILTRGHLEGMAARLLAESGVSRPTLRALHTCLADGDAVVNKTDMSIDDYAAYVEMNNQLHELIVENCGNSAVIRLLNSLSGQPFAAPSSMLPMQSSMVEGQKWMRYAHIQHHALVQAIEYGQGTRAQALGQEHVEIALMNLDYALEQPDKAADILPGFRIMAEP